MRLYVQHGAFIMQSGCTHFPQRREKWRFFPGEWRVPSRIAVPDGKVGLNFHPLRWFNISPSAQIVSGGTLP